MWFQDEVFLCSAWGRMGMFLKFSFLCPWTWCERTSDVAASFSILFSLQLINVAELPPGLCLTFVWSSHFDSDKVVRPSCLGNLSALGCQVDVNSSFLQAITIMEVPVVKIKEGQPGAEAREKLIKSIVNMVRLGIQYLCMLESTGGFAAWGFGRALRCLMSNSLTRWSGLSSNNVI